MTTAASKHHPTLTGRPPRRPSGGRAIAAACALALMGGVSLPPGAWATVISDQPLINATVSVQPNLMFILDNSGSMEREYLPENTGSRSQYSVWSSHCNGAAFNPNAITSPYTLPKTHDGRDYPNMSLTAAWDDGFQPTFSGSTVSVTRAIDTSQVANGSTVSISYSETYTGSASMAKLDQVALVEVPTDGADYTHWVSGIVTQVSTSPNKNGSGKVISTTATYTITLNFSSFVNGTVSNWLIGKVSTIDLTLNRNDPNSDTHYYYQHTDDSLTATTEPTRPWAYTSSGALDTGNTFVSECLTDVSATSAIFTKKLVTAQSSADQQRYANWYSYYRSRKLMMRSAAGRAMTKLDTRYRVGFAALNDANAAFATAASNSRGVFASVQPFADAQKRLFYSNLYGSPANPRASTPLRRSLAKIGRYYGNKLTGQTDPVISACQRNYSILTTDGYWNDGSQPTRLDGTTEIGNHDYDINATPRPQYDGGANYQQVFERTNYEVVIQTPACSTGRNRYRTYVERRTATTTPSGTTPGTWTRVTGSESATTGCQRNAPSTSSESEISRTGSIAPNTLADVAAYYYYTDLRPELSDSVPYSDTDPKRSQHMTTYTLGLGLSGRLHYDVDYLKGNSVDFEALKVGTINWPVPPLDSSDDPAKIDDLWHAAVNGHGRYFSAASADSLVSSLGTTLTDIAARDGAGASAASTSLRPVLGTDQVFIASYRTQSWSGELEARTITINTTTDTVSIGVENSNWKASTLLNSRAYSGRKIYYARHSASGSTTSTALADFTWTNLSSDTDSTVLQSYFSDYCNKSPKPTQCDTLTSTQKTSASGSNLVNFIRGDATNQGTLYRSRTSVLGDMVDASPVYVGKPPFSYTGQDYPTFVTSKSARCPVVYSAANDGMLHAFSARTATSATACPTAGSEMWAYVPRAVMPNLYRLSDSDYANHHIFTVNGTPVVADVSHLDGSTNVWQTILVGGLGAGGKAYYALDVTDPTSPALLWEFTDADLGLSYGNPVITQVRDSSNALVWAVVFTSGMNNGGNGYLYVLDARTGAVMYKVPTLLNGKDAVGTSDDPSGLNKLNAWVVTPSDNEAQYFYAGDLKGNVWRFNANNLAAPATGLDYRSVRLAELKRNSAVQPITVRPELAEVQYGGNRYMTVLVGTGRYLGDTDVTDTTTPWSVYAIKDPLGSTGWSDVRSSMVAQTLSTSGGTRSVSRNTVDWSSSTLAGWYVDLPDAGERVVVGMSLAYTTLTLASLVPSTDVCSGSGFSWIYDLDIANGSYVSEQAATQQAGYKRSVATMGINTLQFQDRAKSGQIITNADGSTDVRDHVKAPTSTGSIRRTSWRELTP
jgi:type IV pilus assembly protein PilY1